MAYDPTELANALRGEEIARANLAATQSEHDAATELANRERTGKTIFSALGNNMARSRGRRDLAAVQPRLTQARQKAAETYGAEKLYNAGVAADQQAYTRGRDTAADMTAAEQTAYDRMTAAEQTAYARMTAAQKQQFLEQKFAAEQEWKKGGLARAKELVDYNADIEAGQVKADELYVNDAGEKMGVLRTGSGVTDLQGNPVPEGFYPHKSAGGSSGGGRVPASLVKQATQHLNTRSAADNIAKTAQKFDANDHFYLQDVMKRIKKKLTMDLTPQQWEQLVEGEMEGQTNNVKDFLLQVRKLGAKERNEMFGSALTNTEYKSSETFSPAAQAIAFDEMMRRVMLMDKTAVDSLTNIDYALKDKSNYYSSKPYTSISEYQKTKADKEAEAQAQTADPFAGFEIVED